MRYFICLFLMLSGVFASAQTTQFIQNYTGRWAQVSTTIANGTTTSAAINLSGFSLIGIQFPTTFTGTAVTFTMSPTLTGTYIPVYNSSGQVSYTVAQARYYAINPADLDGCQYLKIVSGSSEGGARTLIVSTKGKQ